MPPEQPAHPIAVEIIDESGRLTTDEVSWLTQHITRAVYVLRVGGEVRVRVVEDGAMARTHEEFLGEPGTTDVITFNLKDPEESPAPPRIDPEAWFSSSSQFVQYSYSLDTDILVCIDEAVRQSAARGYACPKELLLYVVHGILHCLGEDDHDDDASARMHRIEDAVLTAVGVGPVFGRDPRPTTDAAPRQPADG